MIDCEWIGFHLGSRDSLIAGDLEPPLIQISRHFCHRQRGDNASGGSYIDGFNIPCAAVASF